MRFGPVPVTEAAGLISAHTVRRADITLRKGAVIAPDAAAGLALAGLSEIVVAALEPGDVGEDAAAARLAAHLAGANLRADPPFTGRCNLFAEAAGVLTLDPARIDAVNAVDEAVTVATLPRFKPVVAGEMVATVKIIPYAVPGAVLARACAAAGGRRAGRGALSPPAGGGGLDPPAQPQGGDHRQDASGPGRAPRPYGRRDRRRRPGCRTPTQTVAAALAEVIDGPGRISWWCSAPRPSQIAATSSPPASRPPAATSRISGCRSIRVTCSSSAPRGRAGDRRAGLRALAQGERLRLDPSSPAGGPGRDPGRHRRPRGRRPAHGDRLAPAAPRRRRSAGDEAGRGGRRPEIGTVLLAAGLGSRFGPEPKLLAPLNGMPLVRHAAMAALGPARARWSPCWARTRTGSGRARGSGPDPRANPDFRAGLATSLRAGLAACPALHRGRGGARRHAARDRRPYRPPRAAFADAAPEPAAVVPVQDGRRGNPGPAEPAPPRPRHRRPCGRSRRRTAPPGAAPTCWRSRAIRPPPSTSTRRWLAALRRANSRPGCSTAGPVTVQALTCHRRPPGLCRRSRRSGFPPGTGRSSSGPRPRRAPTSCATRTAGRIGADLFREVGLAAHRRHPHLSPTPPPTGRPPRIRRTGVAACGAWHPERWRSRA